ncbi:MAG: hypothetical protein N3B15_00815 [Planctomycetota bacterium]|nr:hypothetical protein [Planctomycetota bacterium]
MASCLGLLVWAWCALLMAGEATAGQTGRASTRSAAAPREDPFDKAIRMLRPHVMLGLFNEGYSPWMFETKAQGARWDIRYKYIAGGVNTPHKWALGPKDTPESFMRFYLEETERLGAIPMFTWYMLLQSLPGGDPSREEDAILINCRNRQTMAAYYREVIRFMKLAGEYGKTIIFHHEPDTWAYFTYFSQFSPNDPERTPMVVKSSGVPEVAQFPDTIAGFGQAITHLRNLFAPQVLLGYPVSEWKGADPVRMAGYSLKCGQWDLIVMQPSDRDSGFKELRGTGYMKLDVWWDEARFAQYLEYTRTAVKVTGLPALIWQIPIGNTIYATCNNTDGHYMDNRAQYWLEDYPKNQNLAKWRDAGVIGYCFGQGAGGCTRPDDHKGDGITNPPPVPGNRGLQSQYPDDDGGFLRLAAINYYQKGPLPIRPQPSAPAKTKAERPKQEPREPKPPDPVAAPPPPPKSQPEALAAFTAELKREAARLAQRGKGPRFRYRMGKSTLPVVIQAANDESLQLLLVDAPGSTSALDVRWQHLSPEYLAQIAEDGFANAEPPRRALAAFFVLAAGDRERAQLLLAGCGEHAARVLAAFPELAAAAPPPSTTEATP